MAARDKAAQLLADNHGVFKTGKQPCVPRHRTSFMGVPHRATVFLACFRVDLAFGKCISVTVYHVPACQSLMPKKRKMLRARLLAM